MATAEELRLQVHGDPETVAASLRARVHQEGLVAASARGALGLLRRAVDWNPDLHPRGKDGRFIEKNGFVSGDISWYKSDAVGGGSPARAVKGGNKGRVINFIQDSKGEDWVIVRVPDADDDDIIGVAPASKIQQTAAPKAKIFEKPDYNGTGLERSTPDGRDPQWLAAQERAAQFPQPPSSYRWQRLPDGGAWFGSPKSDKSDVWGGTVKEDPKNPGTYMLRMGSDNDDGPWLSVHMRGFESEADAKAEGARRADLYKRAKQGDLEAEFDMNWVDGGPLDQPSMGWTFNMGSNDYTLFKSHSGLSLQNDQKTHLRDEFLTIEDARKAATDPNWKSGTKGPLFKPDPEDSNKKVMSEHGYTATITGDWKTGYTYTATGPDGYSASGKADSEYAIQRALVNSIYDRIRFGVDTPPTIVDDDDD